MEVEINFIMNLKILVCFTPLQLLLLLALRDFSLWPAGASLCWPLSPFVMTVVVMSLSKIQEKIGYISLCLALKKRNGNGK